MAGNTITLTFAGDTKALEKASKDATTAVITVGDSATKAGKDAQSFGDRMAKTGAAAVGMSTAIGDAGNSIQALSDFQNRGREKASQQARALSDVQQASLDAAQAVGDLQQAQEDLNQSMVDAKQATANAGQAALDVEQANLDAATAQADYNTAVKEHGKNSLEARQAALDLKQATQDVTQANLDAEQAQRDVSQAALDSGQAQRDVNQAQKDGADAQLDLNDAMAAAKPSDLSKAAGDLSAYASVASGLVGVVDLLTFSTNAFSLANARATAGQIASKAAAIAGSVATGIATAAQWLWNIAMTANPIGLIIVAIAALIAVIILIATKTTWFQDIWAKIWDFMKIIGNWFAGPFAGFFVSAYHKVLDGVKHVIDVFKSIPGELKTAFSKVFDIITWPYRTAFNFISDAWNGTIGKLSWTVPSWVPGVGGKSISAPKLPHFHTGGVVPGAPGAEMLAVLQAGEVVTPANRAGGGSAGETIVRVIITGTGMLAGLREEIRTRHGGDVTVALAGA
jgi:hypothetical protein